MTIRPWIAATLGFLLAGCAATGGETSGASSGTLRPWRENSLGFRKPTSASGSAEISYC